MIDTGKSMMETLQMVYQTYLYCLKDKYKNAKRFPRKLKKKLGPHVIAWLKDNNEENFTKCVQG